MLREMAVVCTQIQACLNFRLQRFIFDSGNRIPQAFIKECSNSQIANLSCNVMYMHPKKNWKSITQARVIVPNLTLKGSLGGKAVPL